MHGCQYEIQLADFGSLNERNTDLNLLSISSPRVAIVNSEVPVSCTGDCLSVPGSLPSCSSQSSPFSECDDQGYHSKSPGLLDATELGLLSHYLTHTSQIIPFDHLDLYALSVGIPNLAFNSKPVMLSLLALAAACKSHDILKHSKSPLDHEALLEIRGLLALAERHHRSSLQHTQAAMSHSDYYNDILANAALMVLYASASHSIRVHLAVTAKRTGRQLPSEMLPQHSQWISFTRAAHTASSAILNDTVNVAKSQTPNNVTPSAQDLPGMIFSVTSLSPQDGPSGSTDRLFLPLVTSTCTRALDNLRKRATSTLDRLESCTDNTELHSCLDALPFLEQCASSALHRRNRYGNAESPSEPAIAFDESSGVLPWVAKYMMSVTSMTAPRALRRTVFSFLNKVPSAFLEIVQSALELPSVEPGAETRSAPRSPRTQFPALNTTQILALDVFAHWLVLLMLLDGVWWIGDIGQWELGQLLTVMEGQELPIHRLADGGETWWPRSMYLMKIELTSKF